MTGLFENITVSSQGTHHLRDGKPFYSQRFLKVMKYHEPGIAPVISSEGAYHIGITGDPLYVDRFQETFGFYEGYAAVKNDDGWFHINTNGKPLYDQRYDWCGNFQENKSVVKQKQSYFHINNEGKALYSDRYSYVGDFKDGVAVVVCSDTGHHTHIDEWGNYVHSKWFLKVGIYHKGHACAQDVRGWGHVDRVGEFIYPNRYQAVEPFYNGLAYVEDFSGGLVIIDENGHTVQKVRKPHKNFVSELSSDMVGFWKTWTLAITAQFRILDYLPSKAEKISDKIGLPLSNLTRLLKALWEMEIVEPRADGRWRLTEKGQNLIPFESSFLNAAAQMWVRVNQEWEKLPNLLQQKEAIYTPSFKELEKDENLKNLYNKAIDGYSQQDFSYFVHWRCWQNHKRVCGLGRSSFFLIKSLLEKYPYLEGESFENFSSTIDFRKIDAVLCPRFFHYFPDDDALKILKTLHDLLEKEATLYVMEMLLDDSTPAGGLFDINMLVETGGKVRTLGEWSQILLESSFTIDKIQIVSPILTVLKVKKS